MSKSDVMDVEFILKNGHTMIVRELNYRVFDAFRQRNDSYNNVFIWGAETGVSVEEVAAWRIISHYD